jgi:hypothetical protein
MSTLPILRLAFATILSKPSMPQPRTSPRLNSKHYIRLRCRHGKTKLVRLELGYPAPGNVCEGCLVDHPAIAILNTSQARQVQKAINEGDVPRLIRPHGWTIVARAAAAMDLATEMCDRVQRSRATSLRNHRAGVLVVCPCLQFHVVSATFAYWTAGQPCSSCAVPIPEIRWLPDDETADLVDELPTALGQRRALRAARDPAPVVQIGDDDPPT